MRGSIEEMPSSVLDGVADIEQNAIEAVKMDWVAGEKMADTELAKKAARVNPNGSATVWLDGLSPETVQELKQSLPRLGKKKAVKRKETRKPALLADALWWGVSPMQIDDAADLSALASLIQHAGTGTLEVEDALTPNQLVGWMDQQMPVRSDEPGVALTCVGWLYGLSKLGKDIEPTVWLDTLQTILSQVDRAWADDDPNSILASLVWSCEAPLALALQLSQVGCKDRFVTFANRSLKNQIRGAAKTPSRWVVDGGRQLRALLGVVVRCRQAADQLGVPSWKGPVKKALAKLTELAVAFSDADGRPVCVDVNEGESDEHLFAALEISCECERLTELLVSRSLLSKKVMRAIASRQKAIPIGTKPKGNSKENAASKSKSNPEISSKKVNFPALQFYDPTSECALMRSNWTSNSNRVAIDFSTDPMWIDAMDHTGSRLLSGYWTIELAKNEQAIEFDTVWHEVCWFSDDDVDYLELQCSVENHACIIQRQVALFRAEGLLLLADSIQADDDALWELRSRLPLAADVEAAIDADTNEVDLQNAKSVKKPPQLRSVVMPLSLPEWRRGCKNGRLSTETDSHGDRILELRQSTSANRIYAPMLFQLRKDHLKKNFTWRNLTVAEERVIQPDWVAKSYRVQIGEENWFLYRSLDKPRPRSSLGQHINADFFAGKFSIEDGEVESLLEVDA
jgi:hypothetical protein